MPTEKGWAMCSLKQVARDTLSLSTLRLFSTYFKHHLLLATLPTQMLLFFVFFISLIRTSILVIIMLHYIVGYISVAFPLD